MFTKKILAPVFLVSLLACTVFMFTGCGTAAKSVTNRDFASNNNGTPPETPPEEETSDVQLTIFMTADEDSFTLPIRANTDNDLQIDWGDGSTENYIETPSGKDGVSHIYAKAGYYTIKLTGFTRLKDGFPHNPANGGVLGFGFGNTSTGYDSFLNKPALISVSGNLIALLGDVEPADNAFMFFNTFYGCSNLKSISPELFAGKDLAPAKSIFQNTFYNCTSLTGNIPAKLFGNINGVPARDMFNNTFFQCSSLTGIGEDLFGEFADVSAMDMFSGTFFGCTNLTGESATLVNSEGDTVKIYIAFPYEGNGCYLNDTKLSDYDDIPVMWGGGI